MGFGVLVFNSVGIVLYFIMYVFNYVLLIVVVVFVVLCLLCLFCGWCCGFLFGLVQAGGFGLVLLTWLVVAGQVVCWRLICISDLLWGLI